MPPQSQVLLEALYFSLVAKRLHPDEDDTLVESPAVTPVSERVPRVRPPHGFALFLAKEEARKVKRLHSMLRVSLGCRGHCPLHPPLPCHRLATEGPLVGIQGSVLLLCPPHHALHTCCPSRLLCISHPRPALWGPGHSCLGPQWPRGVLAGCLCCHSLVPDTLTGRQFAPCQT
jgi:hypothetical protein